MPDLTSSCLVIADDLTGACDTAVQFVRQGTRAFVNLSLDTPIDAGTALVNAFTTETRDASAEKIRHSLEYLAARTASSHPTLVFKKIDSLLRGNPGLEVDIALHAFHCDLALITPAFPALGRTVENGLLRVNRDPDWAPLNVAGLLHRQGIPACVHITATSLPQEIERGSRYISLDCSSDEDIRNAVVIALRSGKKILWAGSGGLASALADELFPRPAKPVPRNPGALPVLFCIGSDHAVTESQIAELCQQRPTRRLHALEIDGAPLEGGVHTLLYIPRNRVPPEHLRLLLQNAKNNFSAALLSGGDTASAVCLALNAHAIEVADQIVPGLPCGMLKGGTFDGLPVATKSGAFGRKDALIRVADFFTCLKT